jgi:type IV pilus assembly protein PilY1
MKLPTIHSALKSLILSASLIISLGGSNFAQAAYDLAPAPMLTLKSAPGLVMLSMGRDLPFYKAAYNDVNDIDGDGVPDIYFKPQFKYDGYFAYDRCYTYGSGIFTPVNIGTATLVTGETTVYWYKCGTSSAGRWSGNFLNWLTMSRMDVLRKVLYGGKRSTDDANTELERAYIPQDSTLWGKEYSSTSRDGYDIADYTPLGQPNGSVDSKKHFFANVTLKDGRAPYAVPISAPKLIVYENQTGRIWDLVATERLILGATPGFNNSGNAINGINQYTVRVKTCVLLTDNNITPVVSKREDNCTGYPANLPTSYKPTGLLHTYGESGALGFGLMTSTYDNNYAGGVLRQNIDHFSRELNPANGRFYTASYTPTAPATVPYGIVHHLDAFRPWGFGGSPSTWGGEDYTFWNYSSMPYNGEQPMWGNPLGEVMFEALKYFSGGSPSTAFTNLVGNDAPQINASVTPLIHRVPARTSPEKTTTLNLRNQSWLNPYENVSRTYSRVVNPKTNTTSNAYPQCARPIQMTIGDPKTSFDGDHLPGGFAVNDETTYVENNGINIVPTLGSLNVKDEAQKIWNSEKAIDPTLGTKKYFIGEVVGTLENDKNPTAKTVTTFSNIRGHGPDSTANKGSFFGASVARYGKFEGLTNPQVTGEKLRVDQISVALDSHVPQIKIPMAGGKTISILLTAKTLGGFGLSNAKGAYQGTGAITAFFIDTMANTTTSNTNTSLNNGKPYYKFRVSFADMDQGGDNESDAKVTYEIKLNDSLGAATSLSIGMEYFESSTSVEMHQGYVIGGTTTDGLYLDVGGGQAFGAPPPVASLGYYLDTMPGFVAGSTATGSALASGTAATNYTNITTRLPRSTLDVGTVKNARTFTAGESTSGEFIPHDMLWYAAKYGSAAVSKAGVFERFNLKGVDPKSDPSNYYFVNNPSKLADQLKDAFQSAATISVATASAVAANGTKVKGGNLVYQASFDSEKWGGELRAFEVNTDGSIKNTSTWLATDKIPTSRTIILSRGGTAKFQLSPPIAAYSSLTNGTEAADFVNSDTLKFLLGERINEKVNVGKFRTRTSGKLDTTNSRPVIGDIVNSDPLYIGTTDFGYTDTDYAAFLTDTAKSDPKLVGVGSNDGTYRLVEAATGVEKILVFPQAVTAGLKKLADPQYAHQYYVDGPAAFGHVKFGAPTPVWHSLVSATLGAGGRAVFALDASASDFVTNGFLWEYSSASTNGNYLGNVMNKPIIGQMNGDSGEKAVVMYGNGINSTDNNAKLIVLNANNGTVHRVFQPGTTSTNPSAGNGNGMTSIAPVYGTTGKIDMVYAADIRGNIWRIDTTQTDCGAASVNCVRVFTATDGTKAQPITGELNVIKAPGGKAGYLIMFGTGRFASATDVANFDTQTMYGIWDDTGASNTVLRSDLLNYPLINFKNSNNTRELTKKADVNGGKTWFDSGSTAKGYRFDLACTGCDEGERFVDKVLITGTATYPIASVLSVVPGLDICKVGGCGWVTSFDPNSGSYIKTFEDDDANSTQACGVTARGLFTTVDANGFELLNIVANVGADAQPSSNSLFKKNGGDVVGPDGATIVEAVRLCKTCETPTPGTGNGTRRQVWRQLQ